MIWDDKKIKLLIEDYREERILWDLRDPDYKDIKKKIKVWQKMALKFECSLKDVKMKIKNLRTVFHQHRNKKSGSGRKQEWLYFSSLSFLLEVDAPITGLSTHEDVHSEGTETDNHTNVSEQENLQIENEMLSSQATSQVASANVMEPVSTQRKRKKQGIDRIQDAKRADEAYEILKNCSKRDEWNIYGEHVGNELRNLSHTSQIYAKHHINNILFEAALGKYDSPPVWPSYPNHGSSWPTHEHIPTFTTPFTPSPTPSYPGPHATQSRNYVFTERESRRSPIVNEQQPTDHNILDILTM